MIPPKGVDVLLDAIGLLTSKGIDVRLDAVGDIDGWEPPGWEGYRGRLRARSEQPDLRGRVTFHGVSADVAWLMASAAGPCCPSQPQQREAFGIVTVEAKDAGIPSVGTAFGALPELVIHKQNGWVCRDGTAASLAEGLEYFLTDRARTAEAGRAAQASLA